MTFVLKCLNQADLAIVCALDGSKSAISALGSVGIDLSDDKIDQLLAVRGMLADRLLVHGLQKRHLVDYGVNR